MAALGAAVLLASPQTAASQTASGWFRDCDLCPQMVVVPAGDFAMGAGPGAAAAEEGPPHGVSVAAFALGRHEVSVGEWSAFADATQRDDRPAAACRTASGRVGSWRDPGFAQADSQPVVCVSWRDATDYSAWLTSLTGHRYRLPREAEWEYAARAGSRTAYYWGDVADRAFANYGADRCCAPLARGADRWRYTAPVGSFPPNGFGLFDMAGNVWEWTADCFGTERAGPPQEDCADHVLRGGSWFFTSRQMQSTSRRSHATPGISIGLRVARDLDAAASGQ
ncbi:MAG: formylglycine-generating enzyme family protein [Hyphomonadaceae bacterium]|nr:formylglycine-generating enzyme family protein [Hyphomonadaceae bacterium]